MGGKNMMIVRSANRRILPRYLLLLAAAWLLVGCDKHHSVGGGYELVMPPSMGPDSHPGIALAYRGKQVWKNVDLHTFIYVKDPANLLHNGIFVFLMSIPDEDALLYRYEISPQLCAIRESGPPVVLSQRILGHLINQDSVVAKFVASADGVHVEFGPDADEQTPSTSSHDITWEQISTWLDTPESVAPRIVKPLGTYRLLPPTTQPDTTSSK
jgi:hypothetical protein